MNRATSLTAIGRRQRSLTTGSPTGYPVPRSVQSAPPVRGDKAVAYIRVSTKDQVKHGRSLEFQEKVTRDYADRMNYDLLKVFQDDGISGRRLDRPDLLEMIDFVENNADCGYIISYDPSRLTRNAWLGEYLITFCLETGVKLRFIESDYDLDSAEGRRAFRNACTSAMYQAERGAEDSRERGLATRSQGIPTNAPPLGYLPRRDQYNRYRFEIDPVTAPLVLRAFTLAAEGVLSQRQIIEYLNGEGLLSKKGRKLSPQGLSSMLKNRTYTGKVKFNGTWIPANFKAIVPDELFERVQRRIPDEVDTRASNAVDRPLMRFARCSCGRAMTAYQETHKHKYQYYKCNGDAKHLHLPVAVVETRVSEKMSEYRLRPDVLPLLESVKDILLQSRMELLASRIRRCRLVLEAIDPRKEELKQDFLEGKMTIDELRRFSDSLDAKAAVYVTEAAEAERNLKAFQEYSSSVIDPDIDLGMLWKSLSVSSQRLLQELCFPEGLIIHKTRPEFVEVPRYSWLIDRRGDDVPSPA